MEAHFLLHLLSLYSSISTSPPPHSLSLFRLPPPLTLSLSVSPFPFSFLTLCLSFCPSPSLVLSIPLPLPLPLPLPAPCLSLSRTHYSLTHSLSYPVVVYEARRNLTFLCCGKCLNPSTGRIPVRENFFLNLAIVCLTAVRVSLSLSLCLSRSLALSLSRPLALPLSLALSLSQSLNLSISPSLFPANNCQQGVGIGIPFYTKTALNFVIGFVGSTCSPIMVFLLPALFFLKATSGGEHADVNKKPEFAYVRIYVRALT
jgi:hypothetical protein